ncbi:P22 phage major capsid protein family protein [Leifsonia sp. NPDC058248]|uniref:P22 phage major capsid protein family protein n=1 Tax=Leifsonia sp. NPDC058248 TaxID=3346402 RepID=UPI0036DE45A6
MADITRTSASNFIPTILANTALEVLRSYIVLANLVTKDSDVAPFNVGDTLNIPYPGTFVANDKAANTPVTLQVPTGTTTTVVLNKHKEASFVLEDVTQALANQALMDRYMKAAVIPIAEQVEADLFGLYTSFTNTTGTAGTNLNYATIVATRKLMNDNKVSKLNRYMAISDKDEAALLGDTTLAPFFAYQNTGAFDEGVIGKIAGFKLLPSQLVPAIAGAPVSTKNLAFDPEAIILATRGLPAAPEGSGANSSVVVDDVSGIALRCTVAYNASLLGTQVTLDVLYGVAKLRNEKAVVVLS